MDRPTARFAALIAGSFLAGMSAAHAEPLNADTINAADLSTLLSERAAEPIQPADDTAELPKAPDPALARLQVLLDQAGTSPGVIDGFDGDNVRKAVVAFEAMHGFPIDGRLDPELLAALDHGGPVVGTYMITQEDAATVTGPIPSDYAEMAQLDRLGYADLAEALAERFHMDVDFLRELNPNAGFAIGETILVTDPGPDLQGEVARIEADKTMGQVRVFSADGRMIAAYPATIGSEDNPSPSGMHMVEAIAPEPNYTYDPSVNFQQGENTEALILPPGPNGPVGSVWIDLSEPTYGIHGTPEPSQIDKTGSHGCVRLTNWDAEELANMVEPGVTVEFLG